MPQEWRSRAEPPWGPPVGWPPADIHFDLSEHSVACLWPRGRGIPPLPRLIMLLHPIVLIGQQ